MRNHTKSTRSLTRAARTVTTVATLSMATLLTAQTVTAAGKTAAPKIKSKQCVMFYSPRYKKLRIKPIQFSFRWCSAANPTDCTQWKSDTIADVGKPFSIAAYCLTHHTPVRMELRYNRRFGEAASQVGVKIKPHAMKLKDNLAPHPFCAKKAAHRFVIKRRGALMKAGKPRAVAEPKCVWIPVNAKAAS